MNDRDWKNAHQTRRELVSVFFVKNLLADLPDRLAGRIRNQPALFPQHHPIAVAGGEHHRGFVVRFENHVVEHKRGTRQSQLRQVCRVVSQCGGAVDSIVGAGRHFVEENRD